MYRAGLESIVGFKLESTRLRIDPCVPRWWRDFEITYRRGRAVYRIKVENPLGVSRGVVSVEVDGAIQRDGAIALSDDEKTHNVRIVMGEPAKPEEAGSEIRVSSEAGT
jgi:cyclic beta-1,2-glucan synthetase